MLEGFSLKEEGLRVSFIQLVDDSFLLDDDLELFCSLRCILLILEAITRFKVNLRKSKLLPVGDVLNLEELLYIMGCKVEVLPATYLELSLGAKSSLKATWNIVIERLERGLSSWKERYLSKGGNLVLLSVLSSLPTYFLSLFAALKSIFNKIKQMHRDFLWQDEQEVRKINWVGCLEICKLLDKRGLGIRSIWPVNRPFLEQMVMKA